LLRLVAERGGALGGLDETGEGFGMAGKPAERLRVGKDGGHHLWIAGERFETRASNERTEAWIVNKQLERIGLHQLRDRGITEGHVGIGELSRHVALSRRDGARAWARGRIDAAKPVGAEADGDDRGAG